MNDLEEGDLFCHGERSVATYLLVTASAAWQSIVEVRGDGLPRYARNDGVELIAVTRYLLSRKDDLLHAIQKRFQQCCESLRLLDRTQVRCRQGREFCTGDAADNRF